MHVDTVDTMVENVIHLMVQMLILSIQTILVNLTILNLNLMKYKHTRTATAHVHYFINNVMQFKCLWKGAA